MLKETSIFFFIDLVPQAQSFFIGNIGRKKRQTTENQAPAFEELTFTDEQKEICNDDTSCLYDFAVTGSMEVAATTREASEESARVQSLISKNYVFCKVAAV